MSDAANTVPRKEHEDASLKNMLNFLVKVAMRRFRRVRLVLYRTKEPGRGRLGARP